MNKTTGNSRNILLEKPDVMVSFKVPGRMKKMIEKGSKALKVSMSQYMKIAIVDRFEKDELM